MLVPEGARLEIKFSGPEVHRPAIEHWLRLHHARFGVAYPVRIVNNVYFDTPAFASVDDNLSGTTARTKVRLRWYGPDRGPVRGFLEVKCKRNGYGWKLRHPLTVPAREERTAWREFVAAVREQLPPEGRARLDDRPCPVLINRYARQYYVSADDAVRVTIDTGQAFWDQRSRRGINLGRQAAVPPVMVVEMKFDRGARPLAARYAQGIPLRASRHSKYMLGARAIAWD